MANQNSLNMQFKYIIYKYLKSLKVNGFLSDFEISYRILESVRSLAFSVCNKLMN